MAIRKKWTFAAVKAEAKKHKTLSAFHKGSRGVYEVARLKGWLSTLGFPGNKWTVAALTSAAAKYSTRTAFHEDLPGAYKAATKKNLLDTLFPPT